jgi:pantoate--beta-alanine ligase
MAELRRDHSQSVGLVPTMGAFHEGHLSLMRSAKLHHDLAVVSIFVNPTQFGEGEDFERYPRDFEKDVRLAESAGVDLVFAPSVEEVYPRRSTEVRVIGVTERWEGPHRPGHFVGVATVVAKLFGMVQPDVAYFGLKDLQQCLVIERMVADLNIPLALKFEETVREPDGLAMSSRNVYLSPAHRALASSIFREISGIRDSLVGGHRDVESLISKSKNRLRNLGFDTDYLELVDLDTMGPVAELNGDAAVIVAARLGSTRLIDNVRILSKIS